ncbi:MAG: MFS transporter [Candidatus Dormibacteraceae bacterium]
MSARLLRPPAGSAWEPLGDPIFRLLWIAALVTNVGTWMQNVGAVAEMAALAPSPALIALVQTATSLPVFVLGLAAGALADVVDRRLLLIGAQLWMVLAAAGLAALTFGHLLDPALLLAVTFALGAGIAITTPTWNAVIKDLVPASQLTGAITLNGLAINLARAVGPVAAGVVVSLAGPAAVFAINALTFVFVIIVVLRWQPGPASLVRSPESLAGAVLAGLRYTAHAPAMIALLVRAGCFVLPASALWALLPLVARRSLGSAGLGYGLLLGCLGGGAVIGAAVLPAVRERLEANTLSAAAAALYALATATVALITARGVVMVAVVIAGMAWITLASTFNSIVQTVVPDWVRARSLSNYLIVYQGGMALGSAAFGALAVRLGIAGALVIGAGAVLAGTATALRFRLAGVPADQLATGDDVSHEEPSAQHAGAQVLVVREYRVPPSGTKEFIATAAALGRVRRRNGARRWRLYRDASDGSRFVEAFVVGTWREHLRQHQRTTVADRAIWERANGFDVEGSPASRHFTLAAGGG